MCRETSTEKMQSPCIKEASACLNKCCLSPFLGFPEPQTSTTKTTITSRYEFVASTTSSLHPNTQFTNHESLPSLEESYSNFTKAFPLFLQTCQADEIRGREYMHLSKGSHVCLDYNGHGLFAGVSKEPFFTISNKTVNLHSQILYGGQESDFDSIIKKRIMNFMNISEEDYCMVFTANQTSAFKLVADAYPFQSNRDLLTVYDYENEAVETMVECSKNKNARAMSAKFSWPKMRIHSKKLRTNLVSKKRDRRKRGLFVFPLQSKMTGAQYSYLWMSMAEENGWHVMLDASALGAKDMETLGLSLFKPDFLFCSFYKIFGENPSGFGCLFVKKSSASVLNHSTTTGIGIVNLLPATGPCQYLKTSSNSDIEIEQAKVSISTTKKDKETIEWQEVQPESPKKSSVSEIVELEKPINIVKFGDIEASDHGNNSSEIEFRGLDHADALGLILISSRTRYLVNWLVNALMSLKHPNSENGLSLVTIYGPKVRFDRGPSMAFNMFDWKGEKIDPTLVQKLAGRNNISLSFGFLKNIWFSDNHVEEKKLLETRTPQHKKTLRSKKERADLGISAVTASLGFLTNFEDVYRLWAFASKFLDADFVEKERWRYKALNQTTVEV